MTTVPPIIHSILRFCEENEGKIHYSETASTRLSHDTAHMLSATDCSGLTARLFARYAGENIGTYTGNECEFGHLVTRSKSAAASGYGMLPGDCILFDWDGDGVWDHIAIYAGNGRIWNHGGPNWDDMGPVNWSLASNVNSAVHVMVRRFYQWPVTPPNPPIHHPSPKPNSNPLHGHPVPALIARGTGDYYGLITGPNQSHGGAYDSEKPAIKLIQEFLNWNEKAGLKVDGIFGKTTEAAVSHFQHKYEPNTQYFGQVWFDDWIKMGSI